MVVWVRDIGQTTLDTESVWGIKLTLALSMSPPLAQKLSVQVKDLDAVMNSDKDPTLGHRDAVWEIELALLGSFSSPTKQKGPVSIKHLYSVIEVISRVYPVRGRCKTNWTLKFSISSSLTAPGPHKLSSQGEHLDPMVVRIRHEHAVL
jgi:hypothetical protein